MKKLTKMLMGEFFELVVRKMFGSKLKLCLELMLRMALFVACLELEFTKPFHRNIQEEEMWLYKYPMTPSYVSVKALMFVAILMPFLVCFCTFLLHKDKTDYCQANLSLSLAIFLNMVITDAIKIIAGRPRPDFFSRCFPDGHMNVTMECTGDPKIVNEGRKSFPSGHASFAFVGLGFISLYLTGKLRTFAFFGKTQSWKLCLFLCPLIVASLIAISRTCDYHHHWQDILVGSVLGFTIVYLCYRHYFPPLTSKECHKSYMNIIYENDNENSGVKLIKREQSKWI